MVYRIVTLFAMTLAAASAQKFEVASLKLCQGADSLGGAKAGATPGRLTLKCVTTANLIRSAYLVFPTGRANAPISPTVFQQPIAGGPSWIDSDRYRLDAEVEGPEIQEMMQGPMLQALLEDRFKLKLHRENKEINIYEVTAGKVAPKQMPAAAGGCVPFDRHNPPPPPAPGEPEPILCGSVRLNPKGGADIKGVTMADLFRQLSAYVDRDIVDKTSIPGVFDVHLELAPADLGYPGASPDPTSTYTLGDGRAIAAALEKLGLQMRPAKGTSPFLVIDHIEKPSEN